MWCFFKENNWKIKRYTVIKCHISENSVWMNLHQTNFPTFSKSLLMNYHFHFRHKHYLFDERGKTIKVVIEIGSPNAGSQCIKFIASWFKFPEYFRKHIKNLLKCYTKIISRCSPTMSIHPVIEIIYIYPSLEPEKNISKKL